MKRLVSFVCVLVVICVCFLSLVGCNKKEDVIEDISKEENKQIETPLYVVDKNAFPEFTISLESGRYMDTITVTFSGAEDSKIYYTLDGTAPLLCETGDYLSDNGMESETLIINGKTINNNESIKLDYGFWTLRAMAVNKDNKVSDLLARNYSVYADFDTTSMKVVSDSRYDYYIVNGHTIERYDNATQKIDEIRKYDSNISINALNISSISTTAEKEFGEEYTYEVPEMKLHGYKNRMTEFVEKNTLFYNYKIGLDEINIGSYDFMLGYKLESQDMHFGSFAKRIGNSGWVQSVVDGNIISRIDENGLVEVDETLVKWCTLLTSKVAIRNQWYNANPSGKKEIRWQIVAKNIDGTNERVLIETEKQLYLDAVIKDKILYHYFEVDKLVHMVYDMNTGEHRVNSFVSDKEILGYTPTAVYTKDARRIEIDYTKL